MHTVMRDVVRDENELLLELLLCSGPIGLDLDGAFRMEMVVRKGEPGADGYVVGALYMRMAFW